MAPMAFSDSEVYTDKTCSKTCLQNYETLKKQCDDLIVKLNQTEFISATYKRGLATIEAQLITYKKNEVLFSEGVAVLKTDVACKDYEINVLRSEFEKVKQEKDGIDFKIGKFDKASKNLDQLLGSQITDKSKKGLGYSVVPPPHPLIYNRPNKLDLSYSGLDEFKEPEFKGYGPENSEQESNVVCDKKLDNSKENFDELLVEEQVSQDKSSFVESSLNIDKELIFPVNKKVEFTKPKNHEKPVKKSVRSDPISLNTARQSYLNVVAQDKLILLDQRQWLMLLGRIGLMLLKHQHVGFGDLSNLILHQSLRRDMIMLMQEEDPGSGPRCQDTILGDVDAQTRFEITSKQSNDPPLSRGYTLGSGEDSMKLIGIDGIFPKFAETHNVVAFLEKPEESDGFAEIIDFLKANSVYYALTINPIIYTSCIEQFWATAKVQTVNGVRQLQALVDKKRVIVTESSIKRDLHFDDAEASEEVGEDSDHLIDSTQIPIIDQPSSSSKLKKKQLSKKAQRQEAEVPQDETEHEESVPTPSNDPQPSGEDNMHLTDLMVLYTKLQTQDLDLEKAKDAQAKEIAALKKRIQRLKRKKMSRPTGLNRIKKVGMSRRVESSEDQESLGAPEDAFKQGRSIADIDDDVEDDEILMEAKVDGNDEHSTKPDDSTAGEAVSTASVEDSVVPTTIEEITLAQTLIQIKAAKPKVVTTAATTTTTTRPKARGVVVQEPSEFRVPQETQPSSSKDKGKGIMIEPEVPLKRKDQIALDEQNARDIQAKLDAKLLEEQKLARKQEEEANIALIESWENTQAMMEADRLLAERLQSKEREELTDEEKGKLFMELIEKRRKHFAALRAQEKRNRPPTKAQKRTQMSTYLKHMGGYTYKQLKGKSFDEIQKLFDKEIKRVNTFVAMGSEVQESKEKKVEGSEETVKGSRKKMLGRKRAGKEQQQESSKKLKVEEEKESDKVDEYDEAELKNLLLIRADGSSKRYSSMIMMLQGIEREDLEALWRIVNAKYGDTRPGNEFERVLWGDLKVMFL
ncbi:hypothetical protein Tco_0424545 [Tanacetum coccineum]